MLDSERVIDLVRNFIEEHEITNSGDVHRMNVSDDVGEFLIALCETVGYAENQEEDDLLEDSFDMMDYD